MAEDQKPGDVRLVGAVVFVQDLEKSVGFYSDLLAFDLTNRSTTAAMLASKDGSHLVLRSMGGNATHTLGGIGVQFLVWTVSSEQELARCEQVLKKRSAYTGTASENGVARVEGRDPDGLTVMVCYPAPGTAHWRDLPARIYAW
jgi:catechol 2,3-dioxygenase-like lactoylglutathione lyase family enzyme